MKLRHQVFVKSRHYGKLRHKKTILLHWSLYNYTSTISVYLWLFKAIMKTNCKFYRASFLALNSMCFQKKWPKTYFLFPLISLWASCQEHTGGMVGKGRRACYYWTSLEFDYLHPKSQCKIPMWLPVNWAVRFQTISAKRKQAWM